MMSASSSRKRVVILGSTGSIGTSALKVAQDIPEKMEVVGLAAHRSVSAIADQVKETGVKHVGLYDEQCAEQLAGMLGHQSHSRIRDNNVFKLFRI